MNGTTLNLRDLNELQRRRARNAQALRPLPYDPRYQNDRPDFMGTFAPTTRTWGEAGSRMLPLSGEAWAMDDARKAWDEGNYGTAALNAGLGLLPLGGTAAGVMGAMKNAGKSTLSKTVRETGGFKSPGLPEPVERIVAQPVQGRGNKLKANEEGKKVYEGTDAIGSITPANLANMRKAYLAHMERGAEGRNWYDESSADISRWAAGNMQRSDDMANMLAVTSSRTPVAPNLMYANRGWNQRLAGDEIKTGAFPNAMGKDIERVLAQEGGSAGGLKRSPFSAGLSVDWRGPEFANRPTHDIHDMRAWGITDPVTGELWNKGVSPAAHRFLDTQAEFVTNKANALNLGGSSDWTPYRAQAAAWISQKAAKEGKPISDTARHYGSYADDYQAQINREWLPTDRAPHFPEIYDLGPGVQKEFSDAMEAVNTGPQGIDRLASGMGALTDTTMPNLGVFEGYQSPGFSSRVNVGKMPLPVTPYDQAMDPSSKKVVEAITAAHALHGVQTQGGYNYLSSKGATGQPAKHANSFRLDFNGQPLVGEDMANAAAGVNQILPGDVGGVMVDPKGMRGQTWGRETFAPEIVDALKSHAKEAGADLRFMHNSGGVIPEAAPESWSAKPFVERIEAGGPVMVENYNKTMMGGYGQDMLAAATAQAQKHGLTAAPFYEPMMQALSTGGLPALKDLIKKGVVPVAVLGMLGLGQMDTAPEAYN
jgi:hypothetical protein